MSGSDRTDEHRWRPRPLLSFALRLVSVLVPAAAGAASAYGYVVALPAPDVGLVTIPWVLGLVLSSTIATALAERIGKRFLPLAVLLRLSLVFPDKAPSRFAMARGAGNVRVLERRIQDAREQGVDEAPVRAAGQILSLVAALSAHDRKTRGHSERVRAFTDLIAGQLRLPEADRDRLRWAALLHDIGKLHVPAKILNKPGRPEPREWETLQGHPAAGARIAAPLMTWLGPWGDAIEQHHERFAGGGYPRSLVGEEISLAARIVSVADSFEVMTASRSYKKPMSVPAARRELAACAGEQFDPAIVRMFLNVSLGRLWWTVGPMSWTALIPVLGPLQRAGGQIAAATKGATAVVVVGAAGLLPMVNGTAAASTHATSGSASTGTSIASSDHSSLDDDVRSGGIGSTAGAGEHHDVPGDEQTGSGGGTYGGGTGGGSGEDPSGGEPPDDGSDVEDLGDTVDGVVDGTTDTVDGVVDGTTDVMDGLLGTDASAALDEPLEDVTDIVDGILGS
ncbi:MAG TPA: HD-GYP domain-containing protein [Actinomycetota bacterium]|nr:HD-GYP domain-containing protein [Actinomycetota bacterium]